MQGGGDFQGAIHSWDVVGWRLLKASSTVAFVRAMVLSGALFSLFLLCAVPALAEEVDAGAVSDVSAAAFVEEVRNLPPAVPGHALAPLVEHEPAHSKQPTEEILKPLLALIVVLGLAAVGGHRRVQRLEKRLRISQVVTAGLPFFVLGTVFSLRGVDLMTESVLAGISPMLRIGLGWLGFVVGFRFDARVLGDLEAGTTRFVSFVTSAPFLAVVALTSLVLVGAGQSVGESLRNPVFLRDALILGTTASMTAASAPLLLPSPSSPEAVARVARIVRMEEIAGIAGLSVVAAYFRPQGAEVTWQIPGTAWLFLTIGVGATVGVLVFAMLERVKSGPELLVLILGSVAFAAGIAGYLHLSPVVVCFVAGVLMVNFPSTHKERLGRVLRSLERPIYLLFLFIAGALWSPGDWPGWILLPVFVGGRLAGKGIGARISHRRRGLRLPAQEERALVVAPVGSLAVAIVLDSQLLYAGGSISAIVVAVVGGSLVTEGLVQFFYRRDEGRAVAGPSESGAGA